MSVRVKICGLSTAETVETSVSAGADYLGFVFFPKSPRHLELQAANKLSRLVPSTIAKVALTVNADNQLFEAIIEAIQPDILQLHGTESPARLNEIKALFGIPLMKAISISDADDLFAVENYRDSADLLLFDAKPPKSMVGALPGGNGLSFDWALIAGHKPALPWMLSGGLDATNIASAIQITAAEAVDVSSGVEEAPGRKKAELIENFIRAAKAA